MPITDKSDPQLTMIRFLLGEMSNEERASFEDQYTRDTALFHSLVELENDLIDLYAADALSKSERKRLEHSFFADPDRRKRLPFATALATYPVTEIPTPAPGRARLCVWASIWARTELAFAGREGSSAARWARPPSPQARHQQGSIRSPACTELARVPMWDG